MAAPGAAYSYSNIAVSTAGYLGAIANEATQNQLFQEYNNVFRTNVLQPIGMTTATILASEAIANANHSKSYNIVNGSPVLHASDDRDGDPLAPSGSLKSSVDELARFVITQLKRGVSPDGKRVVTDANCIAAWTPYLEDYGMGWDVETVDGTMMLSHEGEFDNFLNIIGFAPDKKVGFVVLTNSGSAGNPLIEGTVDKMLELLDQR